METIDMTDGVFVIDDHVRELAVHLVEVKPTLRVEDIQPGSSLTEDLGFDSLDLVKLAGRIRDTYPSFDLRRWLTGAVQSQGDSVGSMAAMLGRTGDAPEVPHV
jgi:acyl carrier protein